MATVPIYQEESNRTYQVNINLFASLLDNDAGDAGDPNVDYYLKVTTNITMPDGTAFGEFLVRDLTDTPPGFATATDFTQLVNYYVEYFIEQSELTESSSNSSSSSSSSSVAYSSSSSSSSIAYSSSSSSSSIAYSSSSSSSVGFSSSSSSSSVGFSSSSSSSSSSSVEFSSSSSSSPGV